MDEFNSRLDEAEEIGKLEYRSKQNIQSLKNGKYIKEWWEKLTRREQRKGIEKSMWGNKNWEVLTMYERHQTTNVP